MPKLDSALSGSINGARNAVIIILCSTLVWGQFDLDRMYSLAQSRYGQQAADTVNDWRELIDQLAVLSDERKLVLINDFFNTRIRWVEDREVWGEQDYWATPLDTMGKSMGDCEDFAIAKYVSLVLAGVDVNKLRITYVKARVGELQNRKYIAHMVLAYYAAPSAEPRILDNLVMIIRPASQREDLTPVFGFNSQGLWIGAKAAPASQDPGANLSRWRDLLQRAAAEGLG